MAFSCCYHVSLLTLVFSVLRNILQYDMACSFASQESPCSSLESSTTVLPLDACKQDITAHLLGLGVSAKRGWRSQSPGITEKELILNRAGYFDLPEDRVAAMTICPKHRRDLTADWRGRKSTTCCYPLHEGERKQVKDPRRVNFTVSREIFGLHNSIVPIGSGEYYSFQIVSSILPSVIRNQSSTSVYMTILCKR